MRIVDNLLFTQTNPNLAVYFTETSNRFQSNFINSNLPNLNKQLENIGVPLLVIPFSKLQDVLDHFKVSLLAYNISSSVPTLSIESMCKSRGIFITTSDNDSIIHPSLVISKSPKVFTSFKNAWVPLFNRDVPAIIQAPIWKQPLEIPEKFKNYIPQGSYTTDPRTLVSQFLDSKAKQYKSERDLVAKDSTSRISTYQAAGLISGKECMLAVYNANNKSITNGDAGLIKWADELLWREFFRFITFHFPHVTTLGEPMLPQMKNIEWISEPEQTRLFNHWKNGTTGFPFVDAGMNQLNQTGWMHNRLRQVCASFLVKDLGVSWSLGERYFAETEIDYDFSSNNGGWQWCSSTGTDSAPYLRVFNPTMQSEKYDRYGEYIKRYLPQLKSVSTEFIHDPSRLGETKVNELGYVMPIVDRTKTRVLTLSRYGKVRKV